VTTSIVFHATNLTKAIQWVKCLRTHPQQPCRPAWEPWASNHRRRAWCDKFYKYPGETESSVRWAISAKCNDEDKCCTRKLKKTTVVDISNPQEHGYMITS